jgi:hypothetical protein
MFNIALRADQQLKSNVKYRSGGVRGAVIAELTLISNGNFANKDIWADNSVEISIPFSTCQLANYIVITFENTVIAGEIISVTYVNENNSNVSYAIDYYTTAQMTQSIRPGFFSNIQGLCSRTNLSYPAESVANQQPEPFSGNDFKRVHQELTEKFNDTINGHLNISQLPQDILANGHYFVLWISAFAQYAIQQNGGTADKWGLSHTAPTPMSIETVNDFNTGVNGNELWYGGYSVGIPLVFASETSMSNYINTCLSQVGLRVEVPTQWNDWEKEFNWVDITGTQYFTSQGLTEDDKGQTAPMHQIKMITESDFLKVQIIPQIFCNTQSMTQWIVGGQVDTNYGLDNFNPMRDERTVILPDGTIVHDYSKSKAMQYPYWYHSLKTRTGNEINLLPQIKHGGINYLPDFNFYYWLRFIGGEMPKLMIAISDYSDTHEPPLSGSGTEWHTIYEYPSIAWGKNMQSQQQLGELSARMHNTAQIQSAIIGASTAGTGFMYGLRGGTPNTATQGFFRSAMTRLGNWVSRLNTGSGNTSYRDMQNFNDMNIFGGGTGQFDNAISQKNVEGNAQRIVASEPRTILGEGSTDALLSPPVTIYRCGMTDGELFGFCRFMDRKGQATNAYINPLTNSGSVFGGNAIIVSFAGRTYYEFYDLDVSGTMPVDYKNAIQAMFIAGCYLIN